MADDEGDNRIMSEIVPPPFDLRCAKSRTALITALLHQGIPAVQMPEKPWPVVYVPLVSDTGEEAFGIQVFEEDCPCLIGLTGYRPDPDPEEDDPVDAYSLDYYGEETLAEAVGAMDRLWGARAGLVAAFRAGQFDGGGGLMENVLAEDVLTGEGPFGGPEEARVRP